MVYTCAMRCNQRKKNNFRRVEQNKMYDILVCGGNCDGGLGNFGSGEWRLFSLWFFFRRFFSSGIEDKSNDVYVIIRKICVMRF